MIHKVALYQFAFLLFFFVMMVGTPSLASAEEQNVINWLDDEKANGKIDRTGQETINELKHSNEKSPMLIIAQLIFYTLIILVMIYGLIKFLAVRQKKLLPNQTINLIGGTPLGNNKSLQLVKVGGKAFLIGVADQITLIKEFSDEDEIKILEGNPDKQPAFFSNTRLGFLKKQPNMKQNALFEQLFNQSLNKQKEKQSQLEQDLFDNDNEGRDPK